MNTREARRRRIRLALNALRMRIYALHANMCVRAHVCLSVCVSCLRVRVCVCGYLRMPRLEFLRYEKKTRIGVAPGII